MPIEKKGWEFHIVRKSEQRRSSDGKRRTVGTYQIFHDGVKQTGAGLSGTVAETRGPGANKPVGNNRRVEEGRYPLFTQLGTKYVTIGFKDSESKSAKPKPGLELKQTGQRSEILIHPGQGFLASVGCINPCTSLPNAAEMIDFVPSRKRVITIINDLKIFAGATFPTQNAKRIPNATVVIDGEPQFEGGVWMVLGRRDHYSNF
jgi:hypothetical protein